MNVLPLSVLEVECPDTVISLLDYVLFMSDVVGLEVTREPYGLPLLNLPLNQSFPHDPLTYRIQLHTPILCRSLTCDNDPYTQSQRYYLLSHRQEWFNGILGR